MFTLKKEEKTISF